MKTLQLFPLICVVAVSLSACQTAPPEAQTPQLTYQHLSALDLNVAVIDVLSDYKPSYAKPHVEHLFPTAPAEAVRRWANERIQSVGKTGSAVLTIRDASVSEVKLDHDEGIKALFTMEQSVRYDAVLDVRLDLRSPEGEGFVEARATRSTTLPENATINDREQAWLKMTELLIKSLSTAIEENARAKLGRWVR